MNLKKKIYKYLVNHYMGVIMYSGFLFNKLSSSFENKFLQSFEELSPDIIDYNDSILISRHRHFSAFSFNKSKLTKFEVNSGLFNQLKAFHARTYGDRVLNAISDNLISALQNILLDIFSVIPILSNEFAIGINQIRVTCSELFDGATAPSFHQDGYDYSCHICVNKRNILGGESIITSDGAGKSIKLTHVLNPGEYIFFDDKSFFHTATQIKPLNAENNGFRDMIIIDFIRLTS